MSAANRGRPRQFDREAVLFKAMNVFWRYGFDGASMVELTRAMKVGSPSIYAAFGSKQKLFEEAVDLYIETYFKTIWGPLEQEKNFREAVRQVLLAAIRLFSKDEVRGGCLVLLGAVHSTESNAQARNFLRTRRKELREKLLRRVQQDIDTIAGPSATAVTECILSFISGLALETLDEVSEITLQQAATVFCGSLSGELIMKK